MAWNQCSLWPEYADGAARVRIVGETLADRLIFWSEGENVCLPTSHYCLRATTGLCGT